MLPRLSSLVRRLVVVAVTLAALLVVASEAFAADKGKIIVITDGSGGIIEDARTGQRITFRQPALKELGIVVGSVVTFEKVMPQGQTEAVAVLLRPEKDPPLQKGKGIIKIIRDNDTGRLADAQTGREYTFTQPYGQELGLSVGDRVGFFVLPYGGGAVLQSIVNTSRSNIRGIALQLDGGGLTDLVSVEGGQPLPGYTFVNTAPFHYTRYPGRPQYDDIRITMLMNPDPSLAAWIAESLSGKASRTRTGHMIVFDDDGEVARLSFTETLISAIELAPCCDAGSKDNGGPPMTIVLTPGSTKMESSAGFTPGTSFTVAKIDAKKQKQWLPSNFRLRIDGFTDDQMSRVNKVHAISIRQRTTSEGGSSKYVFANDPFTMGREFTFQGPLDARICEADLALALRGIDTDRAVEVDYLNERGEVLVTFRETPWIHKCTREKSESNADSLRVTMVGSTDAPKLMFPKR